MYVRVFDSAVLLITVLIVLLIFRLTFKIFPQRFRRKFRKNVKQRLNYIKIKRIVAEIQHTNIFTYIL